MTRPGYLPQPSSYAGYFPAARRVVLDVDLAKVTVPEVRPASSRRRRAGTGGESLTCSWVWAFPVRDFDALLDALRDRGSLVTGTDQPVLPL